MISNQYFLASGNEVSSFLAIKALLRIVVVPEGFQLPTIYGRNTTCTNKLRRFFLGNVSSSIRSSFRGSVTRCLLTTCLEVDIGRKFSSVELCPQRLGALGGREDFLIHMSWISGTFQLEGKVPSPLALRWRWTSPLLKILFPRGTGVG